MRLSLVDSNPCTIRDLFEQAHSRGWKMTAGRHNDSNASTPAAICA